MTNFPSNPKIGLIGLGYVGLPLAVEFAKQFPTVGFDINLARVKELNQGHDHTLEVSDTDLQKVVSKELSADKGLLVSASKEDLTSCNVFIITVPTPTDRHNRPVLTPLIKASETVGSVMKPGAVVVYESTVYPGVTEDECVPVLEKASGLSFNKDFFAGYSPERINPGDKEHTVAKILKVTSGSTPEAAEFIDGLYGKVITAGTYKASSMKVAEAAKVIENSQRDINIAFVNELSKIFNKLGIDTHEVLQAAGTKWNFLPFKPGLVGGHCIGVDPYYLAQKAQEVGYHPEIILAGRRLNDSMGGYVASETVKLMVKKSVPVANARCLILGFTFKENCPDVRNTRVIDIIDELKSFHTEPIIFDPQANSAEVKAEYGIDILNKLPEGKFDAVILAVAHKEFAQLDIRSLVSDNGVVYDVKGILPKAIVDGRL
ncbi:MAG: nucleotide sugar dehydrogenase [Imperialibacter sp.]|uniref:nucleotide sugar dehydrogenase n=1 Tax=Imperialibacter sp. TaxID=2038411 RepID=UPI0032EB02A7